MKPNHLLTFYLVLLTLTLGCSSLDKRLSQEINYIIPQKEVSPGDVLQITFKLPKDVKKGEVTFLNRTFTMYPRFDMDAGTYTSYLPIPNKAKPGQYKLQVKFPVPLIQKNITETFTVQILPDYTLKKEQHVNLRKFNNVKLRNDRKKISRLLGQSYYQPRKLWDFLLPLSGRVVASHGTTRIYNKKHAVQLKGLEIVPLTTGQLEVKAAATGSVLMAEKLPMLGWCIVIDHGCSFMTLYSHLGSINVKVNDTVERGSIIGQAGRSGGAAVDKRLYFQLFVAGVPINIKQFMKVEIFE